MDHSNVDVNIKQEEQKNKDFDRYVTENGKQYTVPYRMIKKVTFNGVKKEELIDIPHAARLQYRLMLLDPVIKATVNFVKQRIIIIYNPRESDNMREKISLDELKEFLTKQGVHVTQEFTTVEDYDYYKELYTYAYTPPSIRERAPYGYTMEEWKTMKPEWEKKMKDGEIEKQVKFKAYQDAYLAENPDIAKRIDPNYEPKEAEKKRPLMQRLFGGKTKDKKEKGFWFHGV